MEKDVSPVTHQQRQDEQKHAERAERGKPAPPAGDSSKSDAKDGKRRSRGLWSTALRDTLGSTDASRAPPSRAKDRFKVRLHRQVCIQQDTEQTILTNNTSVGSTWGLANMAMTAVLSGPRLN